MAGGGAAGDVRVSQVLASVLACGQPRHLTPSHRSLQRVAVVERSVTRHHSRALDMSKACDPGACPQPPKTCSLCAHKVYVNPPFSSWDLLWV